MPRARRRWDEIEIHAEQGLTYWFFALCLGGFAWLLLAFRGDSGVFVPLAIVLLIQPPFRECMRHDFGKRFPPLRSHLRLQK